MPGSSDGMIDLSDLLDLQEQEEVTGQKQPKHPSTASASDGKYDQFAFREESAFAADPQDEAIGVGDLLEPVEAHAAFGDLKKLASHLDERSKQHKAAIAVPLPASQKERIAREAGYRQSKRVVAKWVPIVQHHRQAPHLSFPLVEAEHPRASVASLVDTFDASTEFEHSVAAILRESGVGEEELRRYEQEELKKLDSEEAKARLAELRKLKSLALYRELKNKRWAKIKSKAFRRVRRKARDKERRMAEEAGQLDPEAAEEAALRQERQRAEERMQLKHSRGAKWTKRLLQRGLDNATAEEKEAFQAQLKIRDRLRKKMEHYNSSDSSDLDDMDPVEIERRLLETGTGAEEMLEKDPSFSSSHPLMKMKFMQQAVEAQKQEYLQLVRDSIASDSSEDEEEEGVKKGAAKKQTDASEAAAGRRSFTAGSSRTLQRSSADASSGKGGAQRVEVQDLAAATSRGRKLVLTKPLLDFEVPQDLESDPLFQPSDVSQEEGAESQVPFTAFSSDSEDQSASDDDISSDDEIQFVRDVVSSSDDEEDDDDEDEDEDEDDVVVATSSLSSQSNPWIAPESKKSQKPKVGQPASVDDGKNPWLQSVDALKSREHKANKKKGVKITEEQLVIDPANALVLTQAQDNSNSSKTSFHLTKSADKQQLALIEKAFHTAGDHLVEEFLAEKQAILDKEKAAFERQDDGSMPGWGAWAGEGSNALNKPARKKKSKNTKQSEFKSKRSDGNLPHVIISQKFNKKAVKYMVPKVPHGYRDASQLEETLTVPLGPEWNSSKVHLTQNLPAVRTKLGTNILPISVDFQSTPPSSSNASQPRNSNKRSNPSNARKPQPQPPQKQRTK